MSEHAIDLDSLTGRWDYSTLPPNVRIGRDCFIERRASFERFRSRLDPGLVIGDGVKLFMWTGISVEPEGFVDIGDESILVGTTIMCAERITIGRRVVVSYNTTIADSDFHPLDPDERKLDSMAKAPDGDPNLGPPLIARPVVIDDGAWIGIGAVILKGVHIGKNARVGAGAVVTGDVGDGETVEGNPAVRTDRSVP